MTQKSSKNVLKTINLKYLTFSVKSAFDFDYGFQYARIITIFAVTVCYSAICPLITPFGLIFMILKHFADRYNIYFGYLTTKCDKNTHRSAITFTLFAITLSQFYILFFVAISNSKFNMQFY